METIMLLELLHPSLKKRGKQIVSVPSHIQSKCEYKDSTVNSYLLSKYIKDGGAQRGFIWSVHPEKPGLGVFCRYVYEHDVQLGFPLRTKANSELTPWSYLFSIENSPLALPTHIVEEHIKWILAQGGF